MDTTKPVTHVSLCAGYGGIDLGLKRAISNLRTIAFSEIEAFACANLVAKMEAGYLDAAPIWTDVKTFPWEQFRGKVDILSGGYPCQPFSAAGKRLGKDDPRHLWPWIADGIRVCRPAMCFFENVEGHISLGLREVIGELEEIGYRATWGVFSAAEVGAPHQRKRVFILAHCNESRLERSLSTRVVNQIGWQKPSDGHVGSSSNNGAELADTSDGGRRKDRQQAKFWPNMFVQSSGNCGPAQSKQADEGQGWAGKTMADTNRIGDSRSGYELGSVGQIRQGRQDFAPDCHHVFYRWPNRPGHPQFGWEPARIVRKTESTLGGDAHGAAGGMDYAQLCVSGDNRTDELRLLGNGVVPATAERAFRVLIARLFP